MNGILIATQSGEINLNIDQKTLDMCIKSVSHWGSTTFHNICTGQSTTVSVGTGDWVLTFIFLAFVGLILLFMIVGLLKFIFD